MHSSPRRKFQKYAVFVLICPGPNENCTTGAFLLLRVTKLIYSFRCEVDYDRNMLEYSRARSPATNSGWFFIRKLDAFSTPSSVNFDPDNLEDWNLEGWYYVLQNILICNPSDNKWRKKWRHYQKQWQNADIRETRQIIYHSKSFYKSYAKMFF